MNPCQRFKKVVSELIDGELDILQQKFAEEHLKKCPNCDRLIKQIRSVKDHIRNLSKIQTSENFHILLRERIRREMAGKRELLPVSSGFSYRWIPAAALCVVMIIAGFWMIDRKTSLFNQTYIAEVEKAPSAPSNVRFRGEVDYITDQYPTSSSLSVSRNDTELPRTVMDTLSVPQSDGSVQAFLTPVDF